MIKQTIQTSGFGKKTYAKPQMMAIRVNTTSIISTSTTISPSTQTEEYKTGNTSIWY